MLLDPNLAASDPCGTAGKALESLLLKHWLADATKGAMAGGGAGSGVRADLFAEALAEAVVAGGGLGLSRLLDPARAAVAAPPAPGSPAPAAPLDTAAALGAGVLAGPSHLTSGFGRRADPFDGHIASHGGVDLGAAEGTPVLAAAGGVVRFAGERGGYGQAVEILHPDGSTTLYAHARALKVHAGESVERGQPIAEVGQSGRATGPHLHFELRQAGRRLDPAQALKAYAQRADERVAPKP